MRVYWGLIRLTVPLGLVLRPLPIIMIRGGEVHRRVLIKGDFRFIMFFLIFVYFGISFALFERDWCWRVVHVALHAGATTVMIARRVIETVDPIRL